MIPKEGGNRFSGSGVRRRHRRRVAERQRDRRAAAPRPRSRRPRGARSTTSTSALGGPIMQDKLWFFTSWRRIATNEVVANNFYQRRHARASRISGSRTSWCRLTWQIDADEQVHRLPRSLPEVQGPRDGRARPIRTRPPAGANPEHALYYTAQAKWTSTLTSRLLLEAGYSTNVEYFTVHYQPGVAEGTRHACLVHTTGKRSCCSAP